MKTPKKHPLITTLAFLLIAAPAFAQTTVWTDGTGSWFTSANWSEGIPNANTAAVINNGGTAQITSNSAAAREVQLGVGAQDRGTLSVSGSGNLRDDGALEVGENGTGNLSITNGGAVSSANFAIAGNSGSNGTVTVSGTNSMWDNLVVCFVGYLGTATLNITNGGQVSDSSVSIGESAGSNGTVTVDGSGSTWTHVSNVTVGGEGTGMLNIMNGGVVSEFDPDFGGGVIGRNPGSTGTVNVSGDGSTWANTAYLGISEGGDGTLHIMNGGTVSSSYGVVGDFKGGMGVATVEGPGSAWTNSTQFYVGSHDGIGLLTITQGGTVTDVRGYIGFNQGSTGTVEIDGLSSRWMNSGSLYVGGSESGARGTGLLRMDNGGTVSAAAVTVQSPGTVTGNGLIQTMGGVTIQGTIAPDQTISITGDLTFGSAATMLSTVTPKSVDSVMVQGAVALNGALSVTLTGGPFIVGARYTLLQARYGRHGTTFSNVSITSPPEINPRVTYDTTHVYVVIGGTPTPTPTASPTATPTPSSTPRATPAPRSRPTPPPRLGG
jgi:T5SS/PEP-CTERM-associated repeat protein